jgi:hypothetical protein
MARPNDERGARDRKGRREESLVVEKEALSLICG